MFKLISSVDPSAVISCVLMPGLFYAINQPSRPEIPENPIDFLTRDKAPALASFCQDCEQLMAYHDVYVMPGALGFRLPFIRSLSLEDKAQLGVWLNTTQINSISIKEYLDLFRILTIHDNPPEVRGISAKIAEVYTLVNLSDPEQYQEIPLYPIYLKGLDTNRHQRSINRSKVNLERLLIKKSLQVMLRKDVDLGTCSGVYARAFMLFQERMPEKVDLVAWFKPFRELNNELNSVRNGRSDHSKALQGWITRFLELDPFDTEGPDLVAEFDLVEIAPQVHQTGKANLVDMTTFLENFHDLSSDSDSELDVDKADGPTELSKANGGSA